MKIRIDSPNMHKVKAALAKANGKAVTHTADERDIVYAVEFAERKLGQAGIAKRRRQGATYTFVSGGSLPNNYRHLHSVIRNRVTLTRGKKDWFLTAVDVVTGIKSPPKDVFAIDPAGVDDILDNLGMTPKEPDSTLLQRQLLSTIYGRIEALRSKYEKDLEKLADERLAEAAAEFRRRFPKRRLKLFNGGWLFVITVDDWSLDLDVDGTVEIYKETCRGHTIARREVTCFDFLAQAVRDVDIITDDCKLACPSPVTIEPESTP